MRWLNKGPHVLISRENALSNCLLTLGAKTTLIGPKTLHPINHRLSMCSVFGHTCSDDVGFSPHDDDDDEGVPSGLWAGGGSPVSRLPSSGIRRTPPDTPLD